MSPPGILPGGAHRRLLSLGGSGRSREPAHSKPGACEKQAPACEQGEVETGERQASRAAATRGRRLNIVAAAGGGVGSNPAIVGVATVIRVATLIGVAAAAALVLELAKRLSTVLGVAIFRRLRLCHRGDGKNAHQSQYGDS